MAATILGERMEAGQVNVAIAFAGVADLLESEKFADNQPKGQQLSRVCWDVTRALIYRSGRTEVVFRDSSALIMHPSAQRVTYFRRDGARQRFLTSCAPSLFGAQEPSRDDVRAKVLAAVNLRTQFWPHPVAAPELSVKGSRARWRHRLSYVQWPAPDSGHDICPRSTITVSAIDRAAKLVLAPHGQTYTVEWWCPAEEACKVEVSATSTFGGERSPVRASTDIYYEHVLLVQCFAVVEPPAPAWAYPLLLALRTLCLRTAEGKSRCPGRHFVRQDIDKCIAAIAVNIRTHLAAGLLCEVAPGGDVIAELPLIEGIGGNSFWSTDGASPATDMGVIGEGPVKLAWTQEATIWLHCGTLSCGEATIFACSNEESCRILTSSQQGTFWLHTSEAGEELEMSYSHVLPVHTAGIKFSRHMVEALRWLRHNEAESNALETPDDASISEALSAASCGWRVEQETREPGVGHLSLLRLQGIRTSACLVRILFEDAARMYFAVRCPPDGSLAALAESDTFRLFSGGKAFDRSFGFPIGCEQHAAAAQALFRRLLVDPDANRNALYSGLAMGAVQYRMSELLLKTQLEPGVGGDIQTERLESPAPATVSQALMRTRHACSEIESCLPTVAQTAPSIVTVGAH